MAESKLTFNAQPSKAPNISANNPRKARIAPLVHKVAPITVIGRQVSSDQQVKNEHFIQPITSRAVNMSAEGVIENDKLIIRDFEVYYSLIKTFPELCKEPEVEGFTKLIESIPGACGCVRGALRESAASLYGQMLPILQARNPSFFDVIKQSKGVQILVFKEKDIVLLEV